jgi:hypothetical protein
MCCGEEVIDSVFACPSLVVRRALGGERHVQRCAYERCWCRRFAISGELLTDELVDDGAALAQGGAGAACPAEEALGGASDEREAYLAPRGSTPWCGGWA